MPSNRERQSVDVPYEQEVAATRWCQLHIDLGRDEQGSFRREWSVEYLTAGATFYFYEVPETQVMFFKLRFG